MHRSHFEIDTFGCASPAEASYYAAVPWNAACKAMSNFFIFIRLRFRPFMTKDSGGLPAEPDSAVTEAFADG